ncbi:MAG: tetratricopeptide repeat protein, partial [Candidatus Eremiobacterota bacterium]
MSFYIKITSETVEKLKDRISPDIIRYLSARVSCNTNTSREKVFKNKLRSLGAQEEEIILIISCCERTKVTKSKKIPVVPTKESSHTVFGNLNKNSLRITGEIIDELKGKISSDKIKHLKLRKNLLLNKVKFKKKLMSLGFKEEEITLIIDYCETGKVVSPKKEHVLTESDKNYIKRRKALLMRHSLPENKQMEIKQSVISDIYMNWSDRLNLSFEKDINIDNADHWNNKGMALKKSGENDKAVNCFDKAIKLKPDNGTYWHNKANTLYNQKKYKEAVNCYDKAIEFKHNEALNWNMKGIAFENSGKNEEAVKCYDKAIELNPEIDNYWDVKGSVLYEQGKNEEAIRYFDRAIKLNPNDDTYWINKGDALEKSGRNGDAIKCYDKAIELKPDNDVYWD